MTLLLGALLLPVPALGQYRLEAPSGRELLLSREEVRRMLDTTRALRRNLEEDPAVLYFTGVGPAVPVEVPEPAFPWNAVEVLTDSVATLRTPANLLEADRAYSNYAVVRMAHVRADPDVSCDSLLAREVAAVSAFADGWVVARTLFGGPAFAPLDEIAFAREAGVLPGLIVARRDGQLGGCLEVLAKEEPAWVRRYREWRASFLGPGGEAELDDRPGPRSSRGNNPAVPPYTGRVRPRGSAAGLLVDAGRGRGRPAPRRAVGR